MRDLNDNNPYILDTTDTEMEIEEKIDEWSMQVKAHDNDRDRKYIFVRTFFIVLGMELPPSEIVLCINLMNNNYLLS